MIIKSLLDSDLYKLTMQQVVFHQYPKAITEYRFISRNGTDLTPYVDEIRDEINGLKSLSYSQEEVDYLRNIGIFQEDYLTYLKSYKVPVDKILVSVKNGKLSIEASGLWLETIMFEVLVLAIVNEVYFRNTQKVPNYIEAEQKLLEKCKLIQDFNKEALLQNLSPFKLIDFGTRRRFSSKWQGRVDTLLKENLGESFIGTSSVYWAKKLNIAPSGTQAHEIFMAQMVLSPHLIDFQTNTLESWDTEYGQRGINHLMIALSDVIGTDSFLKDFNYEMATKYSGVRQDSGNPIEWGNKIINHYKKLKIDPKTKLGVFSDGLNVPSALHIAREFNHQIKLGFGIGTNLTCDFSGVKPLNVVMKMVSCNSKPVCKISDEPAKAICDDSSFLKKVKDTFGIKE